MSYFLHQGLVPAPIWHLVHKGIVGMGEAHDEFFDLPQLTILKRRKKSQSNTFYCYCNLLVQFICLLPRGRLRGIFRLGTCDCAPGDSSTTTSPLKTCTCTSSEGRDIHGKFRSQVNDRALGSLDLEAAGLGLHDFGTDLAGVQEDLAGGNQIHFCRALNNGADTNVENQFDGPRTETDFLTCGKGGPQFRHRDSMAPAAINRAGQAGHGRRGRTGSGEREAGSRDLRFQICDLRFRSCVRIPAFVLALANGHRDQSGYQDQRGQHREQRRVVGNISPALSAQVTQKTEHWGTRRHWIFGGRLASGSRRTNSSRLSIASCRPYSRRASSSSPFGGWTRRSSKCSLMIPSPLAPARTDGSVYGPGKVVSRRPRKKCSRRSPPDVCSGPRCRRT